MTDTELLDGPPIKTRGSGLPGPLTCLHEGSCVILDGVKMVSSRATAECRCSGRGDRPGYGQFAPGRDS